MLAAQLEYPSPALRPFKNLEYLTFRITWSLHGCSPKVENSTSEYSYFQGELPVRLGRFHTGDNLNRPAFNVTSRQHKGTASMKLRKKSALFGWYCMQYQVGMIHLPAGDELA
jgi:hypothetical protein